MTSSRRVTMSEQKLMAIARSKPIPSRNKQGNRSYSRLRGLADYIAFGRRYERQWQQEQAERGRWFDQNQRPCSHEEVLRWARNMVHHSGYDHAYQLMLTTRDGGLDAADFN